MIPHLAYKVTDIVFAENYFKSIIAGLPIIQAFQAEHEAPPFGIYIHDSARITSEDYDATFKGRWLHWLDDNFLFTPLLLEKMNSFYSFCQMQASLFDYPKAMRHYRFFLEYLYANSHVVKNQIEKYLKVLEKSIKPEDLTNSFFTNA